MENANHAGRPGAEQEIDSGPGSRSRQAEPRPRTGPRSWLFHLILLSLPALLVAVLLLEVAVRLVAPVSDYPDVHFEAPLGRRFVPNQEGRFVKGLPTEIDARYRINGAGWNAPREYKPNEPRPEVFRIAVIGDSYVEALQVDVDRSYPYLVEEYLVEELVNGEQAQRVEVQTYGHSGANLAQYLNVLRHAVLDTGPDLVIVNVVANDYRESFHGVGPRDFWSIRAGDGPGDDGFEEIAPTPPGDGGRLQIKRMARRSALVRYLALNFSIESRLRFLTGRLRSEAYAGNVRRSELQDLAASPELRPALEYLFGSMARAAAEHPSSPRFLAVFDTDLAALQRGDDPRRSAVYPVHQLAMDVATAARFAVLDLTPIFLDAQSRSDAPFSWRSDGHWNPRGHAVVAEAVAEAVADWIRAEAPADEEEDGARQGPP